MSDTIFPITVEEAELLLDTGKWESGFGWASEWDWWPLGENIDGPEDSRENPQTRARLTAHIGIIRAANRAADTMAETLIKVGIESHDSALSKDTTQ